MGAVLLAYAPRHLLCDDHLRGVRMALLQTMGQRRVSLNAVSDR